MSGVGDPARELHADALTWAPAPRGPNESYMAGYRAGESNIEADVATLCDQLDIDLDGRHPITAVRETIVRLRAENGILWGWAPSQAAKEVEAWEQGSAGA